MKILNSDDNTKSYKIPIIRGTIWLCVVIADFLLAKFLYSDYLKSDYLCIFLRAVVLFVAVRNLIRALGEFGRVKSNRNSTDSLRKNQKFYNISVDKIVSLAEENDIIEFMIIADDKKIKMGASSDCENNSFTFFDKRYYIGKQEYENIDEFRERVQEISDNGTIKVVSIDGVSPKYYK